MKYSSGIYKPMNPDKYIGSHPPKYRSSWEHDFMHFCDTRAGVLEWASEEIKIPYLNPVTMRVSHYIPDILMKVVDKNNRTRTELVEIKPMRETSLREARTKNDKIRTLINHAKWAAAQQYCKKHGIHFRVVTENQMYVNPSRRKK